MARRTPDSNDDPIDAQRIDKWLWCARFFKTRSLAARFVETGRIRLTRSNATQRIAKPSFLVRPDDKLTFTVGARLRDIEILNCATRRGPALEAQSLYVDQGALHEPDASDCAAKKTPAIETAKTPSRAPVSKKDRRALLKLKDRF